MSDKQPVRWEIAAGLLWDTSVLPHETTVARSAEGARVVLAADHDRVVAALTAQLEQAQRDFEIEREDANQWLREHDKELKRAEQAEARLRTLATVHRYTITSEGASKGYFRLVEGFTRSMGCLGRGGRARARRGDNKMMTLKELLTSGASSSPDGVHWEPAIPYLRGWLHWADAWAVLRGRALAVRQTTKADLSRGEEPT